MEKENVDFYMQDNFYLQLTIQQTQCIWIIKNCTSETVQTVQVYG